MFYQFIEIVRAEINITKSGKQEITSTDEGCTTSEAGNKDISNNHKVGSDTIR